MNSLNLVQRFTIVVGDYVVRVRTLNYSNPNSLLANSSCCDHPSGEPSYDNVFHHCLKSTSDGEGQCSDGSLVNYDDAPLNFSQPIILGLPNPLPLRGPQREWTVSHNNLYDIPGVMELEYIPHVQCMTFVVVVY